MDGAVEFSGIRKAPTGPLLTAGNAGTPDISGGMYAYAV